MKPEAVIFMGIQAVGKSSFFNARFSTTHIRINLDMLRTRHRENAILKACFEASQSFVVDNTNPTRADRARYLSQCRESAFRSIGYFFESRIHDAIKRNAQRPESERVPELGLRGVHARLELPSLGEGFDELYFVRIDEGGRFVVEPWKNEI